MTATHDSWLTITKLKTALLCAAGSDCPTDIESAENVEYHMMKCFHAMCKPCYKRLMQSNGAPPKCFSCNFGNEDSDFQSCYYLSKVFELFKLARQRQVRKCNVCGTPDMTGWPRCRRCSAVICKDCSLRHKNHIYCSNLEVLGHPCPDKPNFDKIKVILGKCSVCCVFPAGPVASSVCGCYHPVCRGQLYCCVLHFNEYHLINHPNLSDDGPFEHIVMNEAFSESTLSTQENVFKEVSRHLSSLNESVNILRTHEKEMRAKLSNLRFGQGEGAPELNNNNEEMTTEQFLNFLQGSPTYLTDDQSRQVKEHEDQRLRVNEELRIAKENCGRFQRATFHLNLLWFVCQHHIIIEESAWMSVKYVYRNLLE